MELRHDGAYYQISPWGLSWGDENYYLVGFDTDAGIVKHYRVDKMLHISMADDNHFTVNAYVDRLNRQYKK